MRIKTFSIIMLICGAVLLTVGIAVPIILTQLSVDATGSQVLLFGKEMSVFKFAAIRSNLSGLAYVGAALGIPALLCLVFPKTVKSVCTVKTTLITLGLSSVGAVGLACFINWIGMVAFGEMRRYPIEYPVSVIVGVISFLTFISLIVLYFYFRSRRWSFKGLLIDVVISILYLGVAQYLLQLMIWLINLTGLVTIG